MASIRLEERANQLVLIVEGEQAQGHPWNVILTPEAAYTFGSQLVSRALIKGANPRTEVQTGVGALKPVQRLMPTVQRQGPQSSVDAGSDSSLPMPPNTISQPQPPSGDLLGDKF